MFTAKSIVEQYHGFLTPSSEPGIGSPYRRAEMFIQLVVAGLDAKQDYIEAKFHKPLAKALKSGDDKAVCMIVAKFILLGRHPGFLKELPLRRLVDDFLPQAKFLIAQGRKLYKWQVASMRVLSQMNGTDLERKSTAKIQKLMKQIRAA